MEWLLAPIDMARPHEVGFALSWHARLMVISWSVLLPLGVIWARFMKISPKQKWPEELDNKLWWRGHLQFQYSGVVLSVIAIAFIWFRSPLDHQSGYHLYMGWALMTLAAFQVLGGWLRGSKGGPTEAEMSGTHFDMTPRRIAFEYLHKGLGYSAMFLAMATTFSGLWQANAPLYMWLMLSIWWTGIAIGFAFLEYRGKAIDTYQAIWGPNPTLPGNRRRPVCLPGLKPLRFEPADKKEILAVQLAFEKRDKTELQP